MLHQTQLRTGNLLQAPDTGSIVRVCKIEDTQVVTETIDTSITSTYEVTALRPVLITPAILSQAGFTPNPDGPICYWSFLENEREFIIAEAGNVFSYYHHHQRHVLLHFHQLQNTLSLLTGQDVTIQPDAYCSAQNNIK